MELQEKYDKLLKENTDAVKNLKSSNEKLEKQISINEELNKTLEESKIDFETKTEKSNLLLKESNANLEDFKKSISINDSSIIVPKNENDKKYQHPEMKRAEVEK